MQVNTFECVWDALVDSPVEAASLRARSDLMIGIREQVRQRNEPADATAQRLGLTPARLDMLLEGRVNRFTFDELTAIAAR